jgi:hypothetical protein
MTSHGHAQTHFLQFVQRSSMMDILDSRSSIASSGQTPTQHPQKSHFSGTMWIIKGLVLFNVPIRIVIFDSLEGQGSERSQENQWNPALLFLRRGGFEPFDQLKEFLVPQEVRFAVFSLLACLFQAFLIFLQLVVKGSVLDPEN